MPLGKVLLIMVSVLAAFAATVMAGSSRQLSQEDCQVMEQYLRCKGHRVQVESGKLEIMGKKAKVTMDCKHESGFWFTWPYVFSGKGGAHGEGEASVPSRNPGNH